jgi:hypothetical protein
MGCVGQRATFKDRKANEAFALLFIFRSALAVWSGWCALRGVIWAQ